MRTDGERRAWSEKESTRGEVHPAEHQHGAGAAKAVGRSLPPGGAVHVMGDPAGPGRLPSAGTGVTVVYWCVSILNKINILEVEMIRFSTRSQEGEVK